MLKSLGLSWSIAADVFGLALVIGELRFGERILRPARAEFHVLALLHYFIGQLPDYLARKGMAVTPARFEKVIKGKEVRIVLRVRKAMSDAEVASWKLKVHSLKVSFPPRFHDLQNIG